MSHRHHRHSDRAQSPELAVYDGQDRVGAIRRRDGRFIALDSRGRELGRFTTLSNAMRSIPKRVAEDIGAIPSTSILPTKGDQA
jgi:hypothetical protein